MIVQGLLLLDPYTTPEPGWLRVRDGRIEEIHSGSPPTRPDLGSPREIVTPAFIDAHIHLPQVDSVGCDGLELLDWLDQIIFPAETWWGRGGAARDTRTGVRRMLNHGTAAFAGYLSSHAEGGSEAVRTLAAGIGLPRMRFATGRSAMDRHAPDDLTSEDRARAALSPSPSPLLPDPPPGSRGEISVNPRFAVSCSDELLAELGWAARDRAAPVIQTHLSETLPEVELIRELFPDDPHYTAVYDRFGLLTPRTLLAHGVHLTAPEWELIRARESVIVHCPTANLFLKSGLFDLRTATEHSVRLALGSDVAGGPDIAMPRVARAMIDTAKARELMTGVAQPIPSPADAWELITRGNAEAIGWTNAGKLEAGADADLLLLRAPDAWMDERLIGRLLYNWSSSLIASRVVAGVPVDPATI